MAATNRRARTTEKDGFSWSPRTSRARSGFSTAEEQRILLRLGRNRLETSVDETNTVCSPCAAGAPLHVEDGPHLLTPARTAPPNAFDTGDRWLCRSADAEAWVLPVCQAGPLEG